MLKHLIVAAAVFALGLATAGAAEMALPGATPGAAAAETDSAMGGARDDASFGNIVQAAGARGADAARPHAPPPTVNESRPTVGVDSAEASERRHHTHWQSLLPGVMK